MKETKRKWKEAGTVERFLLNFINEQKERSPGTVLVWGFYSQSPFTTYQKLQIQTLLQGESRKKTRKRKKSEKVKQAAGTVLET